MECHLNPLELQRGYGKGGKELEKKEQEEKSQRLSSQVVLFCAENRGSSQGKFSPLKAPFPCGLDLMGLLSQPKPPTDRDPETVA
jgi:hypothetical protein